ncbi:MAG TPA: copper resistance CopC family protein [Actinomycetota bacterium]
MLRPSSHSPVPFRVPARGPWTVRLATATFLVAALSVVLAPSAAAHGGLEASTPGDGARMKRAPREVTMAFSEVPSNDSVMKVVDACKRDVVARTEVVGNELIGELSDGQPGRWKASYRVISAEDGHLTKGTFAFTVAGKRDCNPNDGGDGNGDDEPTDAAPDPPAGNTGGDDGGSVPVVPIAIGAAGLVAVGLVVRRVSGG